MAALSCCRQTPTGARLATTRGRCGATRAAAPLRSSRARAAPQRNPRLPRAAAADGEHAEAAVSERGGGAAPSKPVLDGLGLSLGPIALSLGGSADTRKAATSSPPNGAARDAGVGVPLGPIALSLGGSVREAAADDVSGAEAAPDSESASDAPVVRLNKLTSQQWRENFVRPDDTVDLWLEDDFNAPSRMPAGVPYGARENVAWAGKEAAEADVPVYSVRIKSRDGSDDFVVTAAEDRYVLFEAEEQGFVLPQACRMGCCTACAVKVRSGQLSQPQALGLSAGLRREGYALLCVAFADSDAVVELQDPDEVYELQFGQAFDQLATDKRAPSILRDDLALELAQGDE